ncbi:unnamed protein product [Medioppia subpectinata]|uniref:Nuclear receptor domain-containing protein n=1 Tax=Medioppia subpectinata TaxID=1979941 RepID=A0A7R9KD05_9ACAR|nr:unnamed protein product [Medioppia subpectinata]CAG2101163.1 unnamed protein product [Medioppia subpectinata]
MHLNMRFNCRNDNHCVIDVLNRASCRRCRLSKCFAVGMNKEWILTAEEKEFRRQQIEENRKYRESKQILKDMDSINMDSNSHDISNTDTNESSLEEMSAGDITEYIMQIENFIGDETIAKIHNSIAQDTNRRCDTTQELVTITATVPIPIDDYKNLNDIECNRLKELMNISIFSPQFQQYMKGRASYPAAATMAPYYTVHDLVYNTVQGIDSFIESFTHHTKSLTAFGSTCLDDQIAMVKYTVLEASALHGAFHFNYELECWTNRWGTQPSVMKLDLFKDISIEVYTIFKKLLLAAKEFNQDGLVMILLIPLLLFNANRPYITHKKMVKYLIILTLLSILLLFNANRPYIT